MMRSPKAMQNFKMKGVLPDVSSKQAASPLIDFLQSVPPQQRARSRSVRLSPQLGYQSNAVFRNMQAMLNYLAPAHGNSSAAQSRQIKRFIKPITQESFEAAQSKWDQSFSM